MPKSNKSESPIYKSQELKFIILIRQGRKRGTKNFPVHLFKFKHKSVAIDSMLP